LSNAIQFQKERKMPQKIDSSNPILNEPNSLPRTSSASSDFNAQILAQNPSGAPETITLRAGEDILVNQRKDRNGNYVLENGKPIFDAVIFTTGGDGKRNIVNVNTYKPGDNLTINRRKNTSVDIEFRKNGSVGYTQPYPTQRSI
jgi:hypothetical protein